MKIITSNTSRGAYGGVVEQLKQNLDGQARNVVIAPDRFTASVEKGLISSLEIDGTFGIDVMSFTRLAGKLLGGDIKKCLTPEGSVMLIGKVITDLRDRLQYYKKSAMTEGFASELYAALTAIRNSGVSSSKLLENENSMSPSLRAKARDIALIYDGYLTALEGKHSDSSTRLYALARFIEDNPQCVSDTHFYCTDIYDFSQPELEILGGLAKHAMSLTIGVTSGYNNENKRIYPDRLISKLKSVCPDKAEVIRCDEELNAPVRIISQKLFAYVNTSSSQRAENCGKVTLRVAKDRSDEVMSLVADVCAHVRNGGRYRDFEVYASDLDAYSDELKSAFSRYDVPYFIDKKELLVEQAKVRYILCAIACVRSGFARRETMDFVKNPLFCEKARDGGDGVYLFENYCLKYNIEYSRFERQFTLSSDDKYAKSQKKHFIVSKNDGEVAFCEYENEFEIPERVRQDLASVLSDINIKGRANIKQFVKASQKLLDGIEKEWGVYVERISAVSEYYKKCSEQVDSKLKSVLDEISDVLDYETDIEGFESVLKGMLKTLKIALVPTFLDCVFIGDKESRFAGERDLYILGANNGKFPDASGGGAVLTPKDEQTLTALGVDITPNEKQKVLTNMYALCDLMVKPKGRLVVSYCESGDGGTMRPSTVIFELQNMLSKDGKPLEIERIDFDNYGDDSEKIADAFSTPRGCYHEILRNSVSQRASANDAELYASAYGFIDSDDKARIERIFDEPERINLPSHAYFEGRTSVSRLETFYRCPYQHYFNYILSLKKRKDGKFEGTENGTILHFVLEKFFCDLRDGLINKDGIRQKAYGYFDLAVKENGFEPLLEKKDTGRLLMRTREEGVTICEDLYEIRLHSSFAPTLLEAKIGEGMIQPMSLEAGGKTVQLKGTIDRVDMLDDKFLVIDYKTYKSADLSLKELYYGEKVQLYIYMRAIENSIGAKPCGVFYLPVFAGFSDENTSRYKFKGQASDSLEILAQIDDRVQTDPDKAIAPFKQNRKKDALNPAVHISSKDMDMLGDYAVEIASKGAMEIAKGYIKPSPIKDKCARCDFAEICGYKGCNERKLSTVKDLSAFDMSANAEGEMRYE